MSKRKAKQEQEAPPVDETEAAAAAEPGIEEQLEQARKQSEENYDQFLRARAELDNVIKRHERERGERSKYAAEAVARDLLPVLDDLDRALEHADAGADGLAAGVKMVRSAMTELLERHGVARIETTGRAFDPAEHEAVATVESSEHGAGAVVEEHRAGYRIHDRLLRPAMVVVAKEPGDGQEGGGGAA